MREKKSYKVITFSTTTAAMKMEKCCLECKIPGRLIPLPTSISAGCGLSYRISVTDYDLYRDQIDALDIPAEAVYDIML